MWGILFDGEDGDGAVEVTDSKAKADDPAITQPAKKLKVSDDGVRCGVCTGQSKVCISRWVVPLPSLGRISVI
jgi:hypothetical protein